MIEENSTTAVEVPARSQSPPRWDALSGSAASLFSRTFGAALRPDSTLWGVALSVSGLVAATTGSIYSAEIKDAFSVYLAGLEWGNPFSWFVSLFAWTVGLFFVRQHTVDRNRRLATDGLNSSAAALNRKSDTLVRKTEEIIRKSDELTHMVKTLPPSDFLFDYQHLYAQSFRAWREILGPPPGTLDPDLIRKTIRIMLRSLVSLTQKFDEGKPHMAYSASIMHFVPFGEIDPAEREYVRKRLRFMDDRAFSPEELLGVLDLDLDLSTCTTGGTVPAGTDMFAPDERLRALALPIPVQPRTEAGWRVLPGGPVAFVDRALNVQSDMSKLMAWCTNEADFHRSTLLELQRHFDGEASDRVKSFAALPLIPMSADVPVGVLNIHCSEPGLFENTQPTEHFFPLVKPFELMLSELVRTLQSLRSTARGDDTV